MARFVVQVGKKVVTESDADVIDIGTRSSCVISLDDAVAAERHASIRYEGGRFLIEDAGTATGTYVGGLAVVKPTPLSEGDVIVLGRSKLTASVEGGEDGFRLVLQLDEMDPKKGGGFFVDKNDTAREDWVRGEVRFGQFAPMRVGNWLMIVALVALFVAVWIPPFSDPFLEPGPLHASHAAFFEGDESEIRAAVARLAPRGDAEEMIAFALAEGCNACHDAFDKTPMSKCASCHAELMNTQHPRRPAPIAAVAGMLRGYEENDCILCHVDHRGADPARGGFIPTPEQTTETCAQCHGEREFDATLVKWPAEPVRLSHAVAVAYDGFPHDVHLKNGNEIACGKCHVRAPEGELAALEADRFADDRRAYHDFASVPYETCQNCHAADPLERTADGGRFPELPLFATRWHGGEGASADNCKQCHADVYVADMKQVRSSDVEWLPYEVSRRSHADSFAEHASSGDDCTRCHVDGGIEPNVATIERSFRHGVHQATLEPDGGQLGDSVRGCEQCHAEQMSAEALHLVADAVYMGATGDCGACHLQGEQELRPRAMEPPAAELVARTRNDFPHALHVGAALMKRADLTAGCYACHGFGPDGALELAAGQRVYDALAGTKPEAMDCTQCHAGHANVGIDAAWVPAAELATHRGTCQECHTPDDPAYHGKVVSRAWPELNDFDHYSIGHAPFMKEGAEGCVTCHDRDVANAATVRAVHVPDESEDACRRCHVEQKARFHWR